MDTDTVFLVWIVFGTVSLNIYKRKRPVLQIGRGKQESCPTHWYHRPVRA